MEIRGSIHNKFIESDSAKETVLFANTPNYVLDRLRKDTATAYVADKLQTEEIVDALSRLGAMPIQEPLELVRAYVFLVAASLKPDLFGKFREKFESIGLANLPWGDEIRHAILAESIPSNVYNLFYTKQLIPPGTSPAASSTISFDKTSLVSATTSNTVVPKLLVNE